MPPGPDASGPPRFSSVDWNAADARRWPVPTSLLAFVASVGLLAGAFAYDFLYVDGYTIAEIEWTADRIDWLFLLAVIVVGFVAIRPLVRDPLLARRVVDRVRRDRLGAVSFAYLGTVFLLGSVGVVAIGDPSMNLYHQFQPPAFASIAADRVTECVGPVVDGRCHWSLRYPLGTDQNGYSLVTLVVAGMRVSLYVALISAAIAVPIATVVGVIAGYTGGWVDEALMRYVDVQGAVPAFVVYLVLMPLFGKSLFVVVLVFGLLSWEGPARLVRAATLQRRTSAHVTAAREAGAGHWHIVRRHVLPNVDRVALTAAFHEAPKLILTEAGLAFLGLSTIDTHSFGNVIAYGLDSTWAPYPEKWWVAAVPAVALAVTVAACEFAGDTLRDALNEKPAA